MGMSLASDVRISLAYSCGQEGRSQSIHPNRSLVVFFISVTQFPWHLTAAELLWKRVTRAPRPHGR